MNDTVPDAALAAIRLWLEDDTNAETWRGRSYIGENLACYLYQAGFRVVPLVTPRQANLRRARQMGTHTDTQWQAMVRWAGASCLCCGQPFRDGDRHKDHITALSRGGDDSIENLQPLCGPCNVRKRDKYADYRHPSWREAVFGEPVS